MQSKHISFLIIGIMLLCLASFSFATINSVTLNSPADNNVSGSSTVVFNFTASGSVSVVNCSLYLDGTFNTTNGSTANNANTTFTVTGIAQGLHTWKIACNDSTPTSLNSSTYNVTVDTSAPVVTANSPANNYYKNSTSVTFNFTAEDNLSSTLNCSLYIDDVLNTTNSSTANATATTFTVTGIAQGLHTWKTLCYDTPRNEGSMTSRNFTVDTTAPVITLNSPADDYATNLTTVEFNFTAVDNISTRMNCSLYLDGVLNTTNTSTANATQTNFTITGITANAAHNWTVVCTDNASNTATTSTLDFVVDTIYPTISISSPVNGTTYATPQVTLLYTAIDTNRAYCWYSLDGGTNTTIPYCYNTTLTPTNGNHTIIVYVNDTFGHLNYTALTTFSRSYASPPSESHSSTSSEAEYTVSLSPLCDGIEVAVTDDGEPVANAFVTVTDETNNQELTPVYTDSNGKATLGVCDVTVDVQVSKSGRTGSENRLVHCGTCTECSQHTDCDSNKECVSGKCSVVSCPSGQVVNHQCVAYECSADSDCGEGKTCVSHACQAAAVTPTVPPTTSGCGSNADCSATEACTSGACASVSCDCGVVVDHVCSAYQCCSDAACSAGQKCLEHACVKGEMTAPTTAAVGNSATVHATLGSASCANCDVKVEAPNGKTTTGKTDAQGNFVVPLDLAGEYKLTLMKDGVVVSTTKISASGKATPATTSTTPTATSNGGLGTYMLGLVVVVVLVAAAAIYWWYSKNGGKKYK